MSRHFTNSIEQPRLRLWPKRQFLARSPSPSKSISCVGGRFFFFLLAKKRLPPIVKLQGVVDDCCCAAETVDTYNNGPIFETLSALTQTPFFTYFRVNYQKPCAFWAENYLCSMTEGGGCGVCECKDEEIPAAWKKTPSPPDALLEVDTTIGKGFLPRKEDSKDVWCDCNDEEKGMVYINLLLNPERYTGYQGYNATRIWAAIYAENCFQSKSKDGLCLEERTLNRLVSGFHGSTTAHICEMFWRNGEWAPNVEMFAWRLGREEAFLKNIYFTYLFLARAISKAKEDLLSFPYDTGKPAEDARTHELMHRLVNEKLLCSPTFDESLMFRDSDSHHLREDLRMRFRNISQIMDCVECETCKIHAKLQMLGIGTALKILLPRGPGLNLQRNEVIALINTFQKFSESVRIVDLMRARAERMRVPEPPSHPWILVLVVIVSVLIVLIKR